MDQIGLLDSIVKSVHNIDIGRKGLATDGKERKGRIFFSTGLLTALAAFKEVSNIRSETAAGDLKTLILAEYAFLTEELRYCGPREPLVTASVTQAIAYFDDALRSLETVQDVAAYQSAEKTYPHHPKYRIKGMPKDAFHIACMSHRTRLNNTLRTPGINNAEQQVYEQRAANMIAAQNAYLGKQKSCL